MALRRQNIHTGKDMKKLEAFLQKEVDVINKELPVFKKIGKIVIRMEEFDKSSTRKIKRFSEANRKM